MNIVSTVCWCNLWEPQSLQCVGPDVICVRQRNVIKFLDTKTDTTTYFKVETPAAGLGISVYVGHQFFPFFAFAESVLRPNVYVYKYPEMLKFSSIVANDVVNYEDMRFSDHDYLILQSGFPDYILFVYNFRNGQLLYHHATRMPVCAHSLLIESNVIPTIVLYSEWEQKIVFYEICSKESADSGMYKVSEVSLLDTFLKSKIHFFCYGDDNHLFVVDDYGHFSKVDQALFVLIPKWSPDSMYSNNEEPLAHMVVYHKHGFLIMNCYRAFYIKRKATQYVTEWMIQNITFEINKVVSNVNGELYAMNPKGTLYTIRVDNTEGFIENITPENYKIKEYAIIKGIKDEVILLLLENGDLVLTDLLRGNEVSNLKINDVSTIIAHRTNAFVIVGTKTGHIVLVSYEKVATPVIHCTLDPPENDISPVVKMKCSDEYLVYCTPQKVFYITHLQIKPPSLQFSSQLNDPNLNKNVHIASFFQIDLSRLLMFISLKTKNKDEVKYNYATQLWIYSWSTRNNFIKTVYNLPETYCYFALILPIGRTTITEFCAVRMDTSIFDIFTLNDTNELMRISAMQTTHFTNVVGIEATKNIVTWGIAGAVVHFRSHKRSTKPFVITRFLKIFFSPRTIQRAEDCYNSKYLLMFFYTGLLRVSRLPSLADNLRENIQIPLVDEDQEVMPFEPESITSTPVIKSEEVKVVVHTHADLFRKERLVIKIEEFAAKVSELIDYDMSVTGKSKGIFKKFCFNYPWLDKLTEQSKKLCEFERNSLDLAITDQSRIRDWILQLVQSEAVNISYKVRSIFAHANFENFAMRRKIEMDRFDKYRFYDMEMFKTHSVDEELTESSSKHGDDKGEEEEEEEEKFGRNVYLYRVESKSVYDHLMAPRFALQNKDFVTSNQIYNDDVKIRYFINEPLKQEFNKLFHEAQILKQETIENVLTTNTALYKIYDNMNIMLRLLNMEQFQKPVLSVPELAKDEVVKCIMEVDDSEIKAINRRKPKVIDTGGKRGRLLLWAVEFWERALIVMMDGVIEKLWEEEIKKDIPIPEFMLKKQPHEYNLEDQKQFRAYEEAVRLLQEDRRKYLRILHERESATQELKKQHILKLNTRVSELMRLKLKYDYALKQNRIRLLNLKTINFNRAQWRGRINMFRNDAHKLNLYVFRYSKISEFWEKNIMDIKVRLENLQSRDKAVERQFRSHYLNTVQHAIAEMTKLFKKRPKIVARIFHSIIICQEAANRLTSKSQRGLSFPLPQEVNEFLSGIDEIDQPKYCPPQVDQKGWDGFIKLRRQKLESELRIKAVSYLLSDANGNVNRFTKECNFIKEAKTTSQISMEDSKQRYIEVVRNMTLQLTLALGQVEIVMKSEIKGTSSSLSQSILMHADDINAINDLIRDAGEKKLKAMQRVAVFRRQVIFKEWEHKVTKANIAYLNYMLEAIEKCKVTIEFLNILRNWEKVKKERRKYEMDGAIERVIEQKIAAFRKHIERVNIKIEITKGKTLTLKRQNKAIDDQIERMKVDVAFFSINRDDVMEEKRERDQRMRMQQIKSHRELLDKVRRDYVRILELNTILELLRLRTYPTLDPAPPQCPPMFSN